MGTVAATAHVWGAQAGGYSCANSKLPWGCCARSTCGQLRNKCRREERPRFRGRSFVWREAVLPTNEHGIWVRGQKGDSAKLCSSAAHDPMDGGEKKRDRWEDHHLTELLWLCSVPAHGEVGIAWAARNLCCTRIACRYKCGHLRSIDWRVVSRVQDVGFETTGVQSRH